MTAWDDPLVIATIGLVATSVGLILATSVYAYYTKRLSEHTVEQARLLQNQEKVQRVQNQLLRIQIKMAPLNYLGSGWKQAMEEILAEMEKSQSDSANVRYMKALSARMLCDYGTAADLFRTSVELNRNIGEGNGDGGIAKPWPCRGASRQFRIG